MSCNTRYICCHVYVFKIHMFSCIRIHIHDIYMFSCLTHIHDTYALICTYIYIYDIYVLGKTSSLISKNGVTVIISAIF